MVNPFDPFGLLRGRLRGQQDASGVPLSPGWWLDEWLKATSTWSDAGAWGGPASRGPSPERVLLDIVEGVARRFAGQRLSIAHPTEPISVVLESLQVQRRPPRWTAAGQGQVEVRVVGRDLHIGGWCFDDVEAVTQPVTLRLGRPTTLSAERVEVVLRGSLEPVLQRAEERFAPAWSLKAAENGRILACPQERPNIVLLIQPVFLAGHLRLEVVAATWKGRKISVPAWLRLARTWPVPDLPGAGKLVEASVRGGIVTARILYDEVSRVIDLEQLRAAVQRGDTSLGVDV